MGSLVISVCDFESIIGRIVMGKDSTGDEEAGQWSCILQDGRTSTAQWHILRLKHECDQVNDLFKHSHSFIINLPSLIHDSHQAYYPSWVSGNDQTIVISIIINSPC